MAKGDKPIRGRKLSPQEVVIRQQEFLAEQERIQREMEETANLRAANVDTVEIKIKGEGGKPLL